MPRHKYGRAITCLTVEQLIEILRNLPLSADIFVGDYGLVAVRKPNDGCDLIGLRVSDLPIERRSWNYGDDFSPK